MATTPRTFLWERITTIATDSEKPGMTIQYANGNGRVYYKKDGKAYYKDASVTQGHWQAMSLGSETLMVDEEIKDFAIDQPVVGNIFEVKVVSDNPSSDAVILMKNDTRLGVVN